MALDGIILHKAVQQIREILPCRIQKIYRISGNEILFLLHTPSGKQQMLISCHSQYNRILLTKRNYPTPDEPSNFVMLLRKYMEGAMFVSVEQAGLDRWCTFRVRRHNGIGDQEELDLVVELMGKYANLILVSPDGRIIDALKRIPPFENNRRTVQPGAIFKPTPDQNKKNPFLDPVIEADTPLYQQFAGFSPFLAEEAETRMREGQSFASFMDEVDRSTCLYIANRKNEAVFHCVPLHSVGECVSYPLMEGFDVLFYHKEEKERIKEITGNIHQVVKRELKHQKIKLPRLLKEYDEALDCDRWKTYGELLYAYNINDTKGMKEITLNRFEDDSPVRIPLDPRLDGKGNARKCYTRYSKLKKGQTYLQEQIRICQDEITYFEGLIEQLGYTDFETAGGIREELIKGGYMKEDAKARRKKKKKAETPFRTFEYEGVRISFGRNNLQNEALTFHSARKNEIWLHAKDYHGAHVVIHDSSPSEAVLRMAANVAAYYSGGRNSSSVPVNWCPVKELKKIPGAKPGMVQLGSYRTIYIDPDPGTIPPSALS